MPHKPLKTNQMLTFITLIALLSTATCQVYRGDHINENAMNFLVRITARFMKQDGEIQGFEGGGFIVSPRMIVTAAHVVSISDDLRRLPFEVDVVAGTKLLGNTPVSGVQTQTVLTERVHYFPRYRNLFTMSYESRYDVALIVLVKPLRPGPLVSMANMGQPPLSNQHRCWVMGWGVTSVPVRGRNGLITEKIVNHPEHARIGKVRVLGPTRCENLLFAAVFRRSHHLCYGCMPGEHCPQPGKGDSGTPVVCEHEGAQYVVAVHSAGCNEESRICRPDRPSIGVAVTEGLREWMNFVGEWQAEEDRHKPPRYDCHTTVTENHGGFEGKYRNEVCKQTS